MSAGEFFNMAYKAGTAGMHYNDASHAKMMEAIEEAAKLVGGAIDKTRQNAQKIVDNGGALPLKENEAIYNKLNGDMKDRYIDGDSLEKQKVEFEQRNMAAAREQYSEIRKNFAEAELNGKVSNAFKDSPMWERYKDFLDPDARHLVQNECPEGYDCENENEVGVQMPDWDLVDNTKYNMKMIEEKINQMETDMNEGRLYNDDQALQDLYDEYTVQQAIIDEGPQKWYSLQEFRDKIVYVDEPSRKVLKDLAGAYRTKAVNAGIGDNIQFVREDADKAISSLISGGNIDSLVHDNMLNAVDSEGNPRSFYTDMISHIMGKEEEGGRTYKDFGVTDEMMGMGDIKPDGIIDEEEAKGIADAIIGDKKLKYKHLKDYFINHLENNHNLGLKNNRNIKKNEGIKIGEDNRIEYTPQTRRYVKGSLS